MIRFWTPGCRLSDIDAGFEESSPEARTRVIRGGIRSLSRGAKDLLPGLRRLPKPTAVGVTFLLLSVMVGLYAIGTRNPEVVLVLGCLLFTVLASMVLPAINLRGIEVERILPPSVHASEPFTGVLRLDLPHRSSNAYGIVVTDGPSGPYARPGRAMAVRLVRGEPLFLRVQLRIKDRGPRTVREVRLSTSFPFGLFEHSVTRSVESDILVYPRIGVFAEDPLPGSRFTRRMTSSETVREKGQEEFRNIREYRSGDNPKLIAWKASARHRELMVKELEDDLTKRVTVFLESRLPERAGRAETLRFERTVSFAASVVRLLARRRYSVHLFYFGPGVQEVTTGKGGRYVDRVMERLALIEPSPSGAIGELVARSPERAMMTTLPVLILPELSEERLRGALSKAAPRYPPVCFHMDGEWERRIFSYHDDPFGQLGQD